MYALTFIWIIMKKTMDEKKWKMRRRKRERTTATLKWCNLWVNVPDHSLHFFDAEQSIVRSICTKKKNKIRYNGAHHHHFVYLCKRSYCLRFMPIVVVANDSLTLSSRWWCGFCFSFGCFCMTEVIFRFR